MHARPHDDEVGSSFIRLKLGGYRRNWPAAHRPAARACAPLGVKRIARRGSAIRSGGLDPFHIRAGSDLPARSMVR